MHRSRRPTPAVRLQAAPIQNSVTSSIDIGFATRTTAPSRKTPNYNLSTRKVTTCVRPTLDTNVASTNLQERKLTTSTIRPIPVKFGTNDQEVRRKMTSPGQRNLPSRTKIPSHSTKASVNPSTRKITQCNLTKQGTFQTTSQKKMSATGPSVNPNKRTPRPANLTIDNNGGNRRKGILSPKSKEAKKDLSPSRRNAVCEEKDEFKAERRAVRVLMKKF